MGKQQAWQVREDSHNGLAVTTAGKLLL